VFSQISSAEWNLINPEARRLQEAALSDSLIPPSPAASVSRSAVCAAPRFVRPRPLFAGDLTGPQAALSEILTLCALLPTASAAPAVGEGCLLTSWSAWKHYAHSPGVAGVVPNIAKVTTCRPFKCTTGAASIRVTDSAA
jgi:hypothetical protein